MDAAARTVLTFARPLAQARLLAGKLRREGALAPDDAAAAAAPRASRRKTSIAATGVSPEEKPVDAANKKGRKGANPRANPRGGPLFGNDDDEVSGLSGNLAKMFKDAAKGNTSPMEMAALMAVMEYSVKKETTATARSEASSAASTTRTTVVNGKTKASPDTGGGGSSSSSALDSCGALEEKLAIKERDFIIKQLQERIAKMEVREQQSIEEKDKCPVASSNIASLAPAPSPSPSPIPCPHLPRPSSRTRQPRGSCVTPPLLLS